MSEEAKWYVVHTYSGYENKVAGNLATTVVVLVASGIAHGVGNDCRLIAAGAVYRGGGITGGIRHADTAPGDIRYGRGGIASPISLRQLHARGGIAAHSSGHNTCRIFPQKRKAIHRHRFCRDAGSRNKTVLRSFRIVTILRP